MKTQLIEKTKRKTTLKKKIVRERERKAFLKTQEENEKGEPGLAKIVTPEQILNNETKSIKPVREYVDQVLSEDIDLSVINLVFALRKQYTRQKLEKPGKKIQKNYIFGIKEVLKHIEAKYVF